jgi:hypothetical protein
LPALSELLHRAAHANSREFQAFRVVRKVRGVCGAKGDARNLHTLPLRELRSETAPTANAFVDKKSGQRCWHR